MEEIKANEHLVIIGNGIAGVTLAQRGSEGNLLLVFFKIEISETITPLVSTMYCNA